MIRISVKRDNENYQEIKFIGHALFDDYGKDIVCAGVSSIMTTSVNAILRFNESAISYVNSEDTFTISIHEHDNITNTLLENMMSLLEELQESYPKNLKIEI